MSCSIPKETVGFISVEEELWDAFCEELRGINSCINIWDSDLKVDNISDLSTLVPRYISHDDYNDLVNYCDAAEVTCG